MTARKHVVALVALLGALGCSADEGSEAEFEYGVDEMTAAVVGDWSGTLSVAGADTDLSVTLAYAPPSSMPACSNRTLVQPQCIDVSEMHLQGTLTTADGRFTDTEVSGSFAVYGLQLVSGDLTLTTNDNSTLFASFHSDTLDNGTFNGADGSSGAFTLAR